MSKVCSDGVCAISATPAYRGVERRESIPVHAFWRFEVGQAHTLRNASAKHSHTRTLEVDYGVTQTFVCLHFPEARLSRDTKS